MKKFGTPQQLSWDWRAAGNFMFGGTGSALLLMMALETFPGVPHLLPGLVALALIGAGLGLVWLEIGRPWRAINVYFHPETSWMTREGLIATVTFALALVGIGLKVPSIVALAGLSGLGFLYCQAQILKASKGIPAWREPAIVPLILTTGLTEGTGLLLLLLSILGDAPGWLAYTLLVLLVVRSNIWLDYRGKLAASKAAPATIKNLEEINKLFLGAGNALPIVLTLLALVMAGAAQMLFALAGVCAVLSGWYMKFTIVTRAAQVQGYGFGELRRGHPLGLKSKKSQAA